MNALMSTELTVKELWLRYLTLGGVRTRQELQTYLSGGSTWTAEDHDLLTHGLNEHLRRLGSRQPVAYLL